jgi:aminomethyltransferase
MVEFAGWEMPVRYQSEIAEHKAVRQAAGLFDVSHMGEVRVRGAGALDLLQRLTPNDVAKLQPGRAHYSGLLTAEGTYLDDLLIYQLADADYLVVVNAANAAADLAWIRSQPRADCEVADESERYALLALQGPLAAEILARHTAADLGAIRYYRFAEGEVAGARCLISRTGYTGEDGFELYLPPDAAPRVWDALLGSGAGDGLLPAGLSARDTLRLEAGMALYGHELDRSTTPLEAGLDWVVKLDKGDFVGREALLRQRESGVERRLIGFEVTDRGIARQGHLVHHGGRQVGEVASGTWSPTLEKAVGTAYVPAQLAEPGTGLEIAVRQRRLAARVVELPFYRRR